MRNAVLAAGRNSRSLLCNRALLTAATTLKPATTEVPSSSQEQREGDYAWGTEDEDRLGQLLSAPSFRLNYQDSVDAKFRLEGKIGAFISGDCAAAI